MDATHKAKTKEAEMIVRFLAENYGEKFSPNGIAKAFEGKELKIYNKKAELVLSLLTALYGSIFGLDPLPAGDYYWIKAEKEEFKAWFKEWFGKEFEEGSEEL